MKKLLRFLLIIFLLVTATTICYAGDVPQTLLHDISCQVYFGEVKGIESDTITVIPVENIKGEFEENKEITYQSFTFTDAPNIGEIYLMGYINENNPLYIWEITSRKTKTLKIKNTDDMSKLMQKYLNNGDFDEKENERLKTLENNSNADEADTKAPIQTHRVNQNENQASYSTKFNTSLIIVVSLFGIIIATGIIHVIRKNRRR